MYKNGIRTLQSVQNYCFVVVAVVVVVINYAKF